MKVLVIQTRFGIGDMLIFLPYLKAISEKNGVKLSLLAKETSKASELFKYENFLDEVIKLDSTNDRISGFFKLAREIKSKNFDTYINKLKSYAKVRMLGSAAVSLLHVANRLSEAG